MAEMPTMTVHFTAEGIETVVEMIEYLKHQRDELLRALTAVQGVSTAQVERVRLLEAEVATLRRLNELLEGR
jgi:hypothetical protein